ncbi:MAG: hypothetical protein QGH07_05015 [Alphaproteobacteria bacterium]|jgi:hypothetical protein|nr:hypothetical protein [Alphaproteobacteria bacterium]
MVGLGPTRDEGIALSAWPDSATANGALAPAIDGLDSAETEALEAMVRPTDDAPPAYDGVNVFRWYDIADADWPDFRDMSDTTWPIMEEVFHVNIRGFWRGLETAPPAAKVLLLTRYADLSVWDASRW